MTAKEFVKGKYPHAKAERHIEKKRGMSKAYYLIRDGNQYMYMSSGKTESNAWVNAKKHILATENIEPKIKK